MNPLVSIIVPVYNVGLYLNDALNSLREQTYNNLEFVLIDDGSEDESGAICDKFAELDKRFSVFHKENGGVSSARNIGVEKASGEYIMFLDADDMLEENAVEKLVDIITRETADVVLFEYTVDSADGSSVPVVHSELNGEIAIKDAIKHSIMPTNRFLWSKIYKAEIVKNIRFDTSLHLGEDTVFACEAMLQGSKAYFLAEPLYHYVQSESSATRKPFFDKRILSGKDAYWRLVEICKENYPDLVNIAIKQYVELLMIIIMDMFKNPKDNATNIELYSKEVKKYTRSAIKSEDCTRSTIIKLILCNISPKLMYKVRKKIR
ncbi:MAG: glycosyltransferase [Eubacteriales bacterium]|nr:glycosyltransferase [Eubacteriales bacterium]